MANESPLYKFDYKEPSLSESKKEEYPAFIELEKSLTEFLRPQDTDDSDEGTFVKLNNTPAIQFADAATKIAYFSLIIPPDLVPTSMQFVWSTPATSGNLYWQVDIGEGGNTEATNTRTTGGTATATACNGTANALSFTELFYSGGINPTLIKKGNLWGIKFSRLGGNASDTLSNTVNLYGLLVRYK